MASGTTHEEDLWEQGSRPAAGGPKVSHNECSPSLSLTSHSRFFSNLVAISESMGDLSDGMVHPFILGLGVLGSRIVFSSLLYLNLFSIAKTKYPRLDISQRKGIHLIYAFGGRKFKIEWPHPLASQGLVEKDITMVRVHAEEIAWVNREMYRQDCS